MRTSLEWIRSMVPELSCTAQEYMDAMTLSGSKVEGYEELDADLEKIVIGQIEKIEKHPDADKLIICQVNVGTGENIQIVTGAANVKEGDKVPVVLDGGRVAGGHDGKKTQGGVKIKKRKTARRGIFWYDVLNRRAWFYKGYVSGSTGIWNLYLPGRCSGWSRCSRSTRTSQFRI